MPTFVGIGPVLVDQFVHCHDLPTDPDLPEPGTKLEARDGDHMARVRRQWVDGWNPKTQVGGRVYGALRQAKLLGARVHFVGAIGSDALGDQIAAELTATDFSEDNLVRQHGRRSRSAIVWIDRNGERSILTDSGSLDPLADVATQALIETAPDVVHIESREMIAAGALGAAASARGITVHYDIDPWTNSTEQLLKHTDYAQVSIRHMDESVSSDNALDAACNLQAKFDLDLAVVTKSADGISVAGRDGFTLELPAYRSTSVDSTGAGDAFAGTFEFYRTVGADLATALRSASAAGALISSQLGNSPLPDEDEIAAVTRGH